MVGVEIGQGSLGFHTASGPAHREKEGKGLFCTGQSLP